MSESNDFPRGILESELRRIEGVLRAEMKSGFITASSASDAILQQVTRIASSVSDMHARLTSLELWRGQATVSDEQRDRVAAHWVTHFETLMKEAAVEQKELRNTVESLKIADRVSRASLDAQAGLLARQWKILGGAFSFGFGVALIIVQLIPLL